MNEKVFSRILIVVCFLLAGCCTNRNITTDISDIIDGNSRTVGQLEATVAALDGTVSSSRERIETIIATSRNIADGIERVEYLFNQYENETNRLLNEIDRIRNEIEVQSENNSDSGNTADSVYSGEDCPDCVKN